ncbi:MAG: ArsR/SmtB family transcription factor [Caulobacteraceae bacterium]
MSDEADAAEEENAREAEATAAYVQRRESFDGQLKLVERATLRLSPWPPCIPFYYTRNMESTTIRTNAALDAFSALANESRLAIFRLLVQAGPEGRAAGDIADKLGIPASSLSFHLAHLTRAGLTEQRRESRSLIYSANFATMNGLVDFLTENCCGGASCAPVSSRTKRKAS